MKYAIFCLTLLSLMAGCERKVNSLDAHDQSGATEASKLGAGNHGTAPPPTPENGSSPTSPVTTATHTDSHSP